MASGKCHDAVALVSTAALIPIAFYSSRVIAPFVVAGAIAGGAIISPDIDLAHSLPAKRWGIMRPLTKLYRMFHYRHRGASHWPIVGAGLRSLLLNELPRLAGERGFRSYGLKFRTCQRCHLLHASAISRGCSSTA